MSNDCRYLTPSRAAERLSLRVEDVMEMVRLGELPALQMGGDHVRIPSVAVESQALQTASRAALVIRSVQPSPRLKRRSVAEREREFQRVTGRTAREYLLAFESHVPDVVAEGGGLLIEAEELVSAARGR